MALTGGGELYLPGGNYYIGQPIIVPSNITIRGSGPNTIINITQDTSAFMVMGVTHLTTTITKDITRSERVGGIHTIITVESAIGFKPGDYIQILQKKSSPYITEFNRIYSIEKNHITLQDRLIENYYVSDDVKIIQVLFNKNVEIKNLKIAGISQNINNWLIAEYVSGFKIDNVLVENLTQNGIFIENSSNTKILNSQFTNNGRPGRGDLAIFIKNSFKTVIADNQFTNTGPIYLNGATYSMIQNNMIDGSGITNGDGITINYSVGNSIASNIILKANCYGIALSESARNIITNNQILSSITTGIMLNPHSYNNVINENILKFNDGNGIFVDFNSDNNILTNNSLSQNSGRGILIHGSYNIIKNNISINNSLKNILMIENANNVSEGNIENK